MTGRALRFTNRRRCAYFGREKAPGRVGRAARALAAVLWWWCVALLRLVALCAPPPGPSAAPPSARAAEDAVACASAPSNTTESTPPPPSPPRAAPDLPAHTGQYDCYPRVLGRGAAAGRFGSGALVDFETTPLNNHIICPYFQLLVAKFRECAHASY